MLAPRLAAHCFAVTALLMSSIPGRSLLRAQTRGALPTPAVEAAGREILREMIETDTRHATGSTTALCEKLERRLLEAGFPAADVVVVGDAPEKKNLVARYRGARGVRPPVLFIAHLDVVEAKREDWSVDPFTLVEREGYYYGRGTLDVKGGAATLLAAFLRLRAEGWVPDRDLILALTADEEGGEDNGIDWLLRHRRDLIEAAYTINFDSGGGELEAGRLVAFDVQASEKVYASFSVTAKSAGGHSSLPVAGNPIGRLAAGLARLGEFRFPVRMNEITRTYFERKAGLAKSESEAAEFRAVAAAPPDAAAIERLSASSPFYNAQFRTTCVPTLISGGHAENALPQAAQATINCRMLPDERVEDVEATLVRVLADAELVVASVRPVRAGPPSPLVPEVFAAIERTAQAIWGGVPIVPVMETGATDGLYLRNAGIPVYGLTGISYDVNDVRAHGRDERILVRSYAEGLEFAWRLMQELSAASGR